MTEELKQAAQQALEALIEASGHVNNEPFVKVMMARDALVSALTQRPAAQTEREADGLPLIVAGAIFDFAGFMTTRAEVIEVGSTAEAGPVADLVKEWAELRGLDLADAAVLSWQLHITRASLPAPQQATPTRATREAEQRARMQARLAARHEGKATADFDLPAQNDAPQQATPEYCKDDVALALAAAQQSYPNPGEPEAGWCLLERKHVEVLCRAAQQATQFPLDFVSDPSIAPGEAVVKLGGREVGRIVNIEAQQATPEPSRGMIGMGAQALAGELGAALNADLQMKNAIGMLGTNTMAWLRKVATEYLSRPATPEPAVSELPGAAREEWEKVVHVAAQVASTSMVPVKAHALRAVAAALAAAQAKGGEHE